MIKFALILLSIIASTQSTYFNAVYDCNLDSNGNILSTLRFLIEPPYYVNHYLCVISDEFLRSGGYCDPAFSEDDWCKDHYGWNSVDFDVYDGVVVWDQYHNNGGIFPNLPENDKYFKCAEINYVRQCVIDPNPTRRLRNLNQNKDENSESFENRLTNEMEETKRILNKRIDRVNKIESGEDKKIKPENKGRVLLGLKKDNERDAKLIAGAEEKIVQLRRRRNLSDSSQIVQQQNNKEPTQLRFLEK